MKQILKFILFFLFSGIAFSQKNIVINNLQSRTDTDGSIIDAHDGRIVKFGDKFYWYGTAYEGTSGFARTHYFQCYSSSDLMTWKKEGKLVENLPSGYYYRPHVIYNKKTKKYVLWYNWYPVLWDGKFGVAVSDTPTGPFKIVDDDVKVQNSKYGVGDFGLFVDDDNTAYIAYNTIEGHKGSIEKLSSDYRKSTFENSGFITEGCEAGAIFKRNGIYYMLTDYTCCFCTEGSGVRVYVSDNPMKGYKQKNNINRYPGTPVSGLLDGIITPNIYTTIKKEDKSLSPIQIDFNEAKQLNSLKIYQFTGNRQGTFCGDTLATQRHYNIETPGFELYVKQNSEWLKVTTGISVESTSVYNIITLEFNTAITQSVLLKPVDNYPYDELFINKIKMFHNKNELKVFNSEAMTFINNINPKSPLLPVIIPAQQTFVMPLNTTTGIEYIWMGDLWGSAGDNIKGHDQQYWGSPLVFDVEGNIETMKWVDEWQITIE